MTDASQIRLGPAEQAGGAGFGARGRAGWSHWLAGGIALTMTTFQLWTAAVGTLPGVLQRSIHLTFAMALCFLFYPFNRKIRRTGLPWYDLALAALGAYAALYVTIHHSALIQRVGRRRGSGTA